MNSNNLLLIAAALLLLSVVVSSTDDDEPDDSSADLEDIANQVEGAVSAIGDSEDDMTIERNVAAFLAAISYGEGTNRPDGYRVMFGGNTFDSFGDHPALLGWGGVKLSDAMCAGAGLSAGCVSTAAGRYQITRTTWRSLKAKLNLPDFSEASQDAAAIELISQRGALADVKAGRIEAAVRKCAKTWASLPGAGYGQPEVKLAAFLSNYQKEGGALA